jgi:hypothetical protein
MLECFQMRCSTRQSAGVSYETLISKLLRRMSV